MEDGYSIQRLLTLRKLTRAIADLLRSQMKDYLATLAPVLRPRAVLGDYVESNFNETARGADKAFKDLQALYATVAASKPFELPTELTPPVEIIHTSLEITPTEYTHEAKTERETKVVTITSPLRWTLNYSGFAPARLKELLADRDRSSDELRQFIIHYLVMHTVLAKQTGVANIFDALHFHISSGKIAEFGPLPVTSIASSITTLRPPDEVIIESTEISGTPAFEEIVNTDDIIRMQNPLKEKLLEIIKNQGQSLQL